MFEPFKGCVKQGLLDTGLIAFRESRSAYGSQTTENPGPGHSVSLGSVLEVPHSFSFPCAQNTAWAPNQITSGASVVVYLGICLAL